MGKLSEDETIKAEVEDLRPLIDKMKAGLNAGYTAEQLSGPPSLGLVNSLLAQIAASMTDHNEKRLDVLERRSGILKSAKPITRSVTNVLKHDAAGRIEQFEKVEGPAEELDLYAKLAALEQRLADGGLKYRGIWSKSESYRAGDFATSHGSVWFAKAASIGVQPGEATSGVWVFAVKRGRDGRDARNVEPVLK